MITDFRWYHPAPPSKVVIKNERSFEGINLETPGANTKQTTALTRFQLCSRCYENERRSVFPLHLSDLLAHSNVVPRFSIIHASVSAPFEGHEK